MTGEAFSRVLCVLLTMLMLPTRIHILTLTCGIQNFNETLLAKEGSFTTITYILNAKDTAFLEKTAIVFDVCQNNQLATECAFRWRTQVNDMTVRTWGSVNQTSCSCERLHLDESMFTWKLTILHLVDRSLSLMHLYVENFTQTKRTIQTIRLMRVDVLWVDHQHVTEFMFELCDAHLSKDPSRVTSLTVDGQEVGSFYSIDKGQKVNISCFYDKGNPPATFRLLDKHGHELSDREGNLTYSLSAQCEDDRPTVRCEGSGSEKNRSVSFHVRFSGIGWRPASRHA